MAASTLTQAVRAGGNILRLKPDLDEDREAFGRFRVNHRAWLRAAVIASVAFAAVLALLFVTDTLDDVYRAMYMTCCWDRPWTHVMRDAPLFYVVAFVGPALLIARFFPETVGARWIIVAVVLGVGYVGGHAFWSSSVDSVVKGAGVEPGATPEAHAAFDTVRGRT